MAGKDKEPDSVSHKQESSIPFMPPGIGPTIHSTTVRKGKDTYTSYGSSEEEANKNAGEKYSEGEKD
jgi:hypothetical protein